MYTVKQLSDLAQVSVRTLTAVDEIGLLIPSRSQQSATIRGRGRDARPQQILTVKSA